MMKNSKIKTTNAIIAKIQHNNQRSRNTMQRRFGCMHTSLDGDGRECARLYGRPQVGGEARSGEVRRRAVGSSSGDLDFGDRFRSRGEIRPDERPEPECDPDGDRRPPPAPDEP